MYVIYYEVMAAHHLGSRSRLQDTPKTQASSEFRGFGGLGFRVQGLGFRVLGPAQATTLQSAPVKKEKSGSSPCLSSMPCLRINSCPTSPATLAWGRASSFLKCVRDIAAAVFAIVTSATATSFSTISIASTPAVPFTSLFPFHCSEHVWSSVFFVS